MQLVQLKACPFCGGAAQIRAVARDWYRLTCYHDTMCMLEDFEMTVPQTDEQFEALVTDWNRRDEPDPKI